MAKLSLVVVSAVLFFSACGKAGIGEACSKDADCGDGTSCILNGGEKITSTGTSCIDTDKLCSITCNVDADCATLGTGYICVNECFQGSCLKGSR